MITKYELGMPCMFGEAVGRIVEECEEGSEGLLNGKRAWSIILFSTPHGTVVKTGIGYVNDVTEDGLKRLAEYEAEEIEKPYNGLYKLNNK